MSALDGKRRPVRASFVAPGTRPCEWIDGLCRTPDFSRADADRVSRPRTNAGLRPSCPSLEWRGVAPCVRALSDVTLPTHSRPKTSARSISNRTCVRSADTPTGGSGIYRTPGGVSADGRSPESTEIGSPPTTSQNVPSPMDNREEGPRAGTGGLHDDSSTGEARCLPLRHRRAAGRAPMEMNE